MRLALFGLMVLTVCADAQQERRRGVMQPVVSGDIATGLQFLYPLTSDANDASGNGNNLSLTGGANIGGGNLNLDGAGDWASHASATALNAPLVGDFTMILRILVESGNRSIERYIINKGASDGIYLFIDTSGRFNVQLVDGGVGDPVISSVVDNDAEHTIAVRRSGSTLDVFIDTTGSATSTGATPAGDASSGDAFYLGTYAADPSYSLNGYMRQVGGYSRALTSADMALYFATYP